MTMKTSFLTPLFLVLLAAVLSVGCRSARSDRPVATHPQRTHLPPGHAKKVYGHRSARAFAPGQQKKVVKKKVVVKGKKGPKGKGRK